MDTAEPRTVTSNVELTRSVTSPVLSSADAERGRTAGHTARIDRRLGRLDIFALRLCGFTQYPGYRSSVASRTRGRGGVEAVCVLFHCARGGGRGRRVRAVDTCTASRSLRFESKDLILSGAIFLPLGTFQARKRR
jgi:hypothetical protein